eukprot:8735212-Pyramimonas_sp.AAC.1
MSLVHVHSCAFLISASPLGARVQECSSAKPIAYLSRLGGTGLFNFPDDETLGVLSTVHCEVSSRDSASTSEGVDGHCDAWLGSSPFVEDTERSPKLKHAEDVSDM